MSAPGRARSGRSWLIDIDAHDGYFYSEFIYCFGTTTTDSFPTSSMRLRNILRQIDTSMIEATMTKCLRLVCVPRVMPSSIIGPNTIRELYNFPSTESASRRVKMSTAQVVSLMFHSFACSGSRFCINLRILSKSAPRFQAQALSSCAPLLVPLRTFVIYLPAHGRNLTQG